MILRTPGMYYYHPALQEAQRSGVAVVSEMELFFDLCPCKIYAVTGSDGKTTTTSVIAEFLKAQGFNVFWAATSAFRCCLASSRSARRTARWWSCPASR